MAAYLSRFDEEAPEIEVSGELHRRKDRFSKEYCTLAGPVTLKRMLYIPGGGGKAVCPLDLRVGMVEGYWTPLAARVAARAVAGSTPREVAELLEEIGGMKPSSSSLDRLPKRLSERWEENRDFLEDELLGVSPEKTERALDPYHALEPIQEALDAYHGEGTWAAKAALEECRIWLRDEHDRVERVLRALRHRRNKSRGKERPAIAIEIRYLAERKTLMSIRSSSTRSSQSGAGSSRLPARPSRPNV